MHNQFQKETDIVFSLLDIDNDGVITVQEATIGLKALDIDVTEDIIEAYTNENYVTKKVFNSLVVQLLPKTSFENSILRSFYLLDDQNKGYITEDNLQTKIHELGLNITPENLNNMISKADFDRKGYVNEFDFINVMKKAYEYNDSVKRKLN